MTLQANDLFTDTNGTVIASHAPDFDREAGGWTDHKDAASIQSNQYQYTDGANNFSLSTIDLGTTEQLIRLDGQIPNTSGTLEDVSIVLRFVDASNYWICRATGDGFAEIVKVLAGVFTVEANLLVSAYIPGANVTLEARARNDTIQLLDLANNVNIVFDSTTHNAATEAGVTLQSSVGGAGGGFIDNFKTYDMTPIGALPMGGRLFLPRMVSFPTAAQTIKAGGVSWDVSASQKGHWLCNDNLPSTVILDASGAPVNNGTLIGTGPNTEDIFQAVGKINGSLLCNGTDNSFNINSVVGDTSSDIAGGWVFWINPTSIVGTLRLMSFADTDANEDIILTMLSSGKLRWFCADAAVTQWSVETNNVVLSAGTFTQIAVMQDETTNAPQIFINTVLVPQTSLDSTNNTTWLAALSGVDNARVASLLFNGGAEAGFMGGSYDDIRIFNRKLSTPELLGLNNGGNGTEADSGIF